MLEKLKATVKHYLRPRSHRRFLDKQQAKNTASAKAKADDLKNTGGKRMHPLQSFRTTVRPSRAFGHTITASAPGATSRLRSRASGEQLRKPLHEVVKGIDKRAAHNDVVRKKLAQTRSTTVSSHGPVTSKITAKAPSRIKKRVPAGAKVKSQMAMAGGKVRSKGKRAALQTHSYMA